MPNLPECKDPAVRQTLRQVLFNVQDQYFETLRASELEKVSRTQVERAQTIFDQTSDGLLGGITLGGVRRGVSQSGTLGYWMGAPHAGKRRMTRAVATTVEFAFSKLRLHRVEAACIPDNAPSIALLERNGFQREGYAREYLKIDGAWRYHVLFALV